MGTVMPLHSGASGMNKLNAGPASSPSIHGTADWKSVLILVMGSSGRLIELEPQAECRGDFH